MLQIFISDQYQRSFESQKVTINSSQQSEALADFSQSSNSTYQTSTDGMESCLLQGSAERPKSHGESQSVITWRVPSWCYDRAMMGCRNLLEVL